MQTHTFILLRARKITLTPTLPKTTYPVIWQTNEKVPVSLLPWLMAGGSLTAQFEALGGHPLKVVPVLEGFKYLDHFTSQDLLLPRPQMAWVREVELYGTDQKPWAQAESVFPISALKGKGKRLKNLGSTPLGYVLFGRHRPSCQRVITSIEIQGETCFTRQNFYNWCGHDILVQETFLPSFLDRLSA